MNMTGVKAQNSCVPEADADGWTLVCDRYAPADRDRNAAIFTLGDGFIGLRGVAEETPAEARAGAAVYLNGVYETSSIQYYEKAHGFAETSDTRIPAADPTVLNVEIGGERFSLDSGEIADFHQRLHLKDGRMTRSVRWRSPKGREADIRFERLVSLTRPGLVALRLSVTMRGTVAPLAIRSQLIMPRPRGKLAQDGVHDPRVSPAFNQSPWRLQQRFTEPGAMGFQHRARASGIGVAVRMAHFIEAGDVENRHVDGNDDQIQEELHFTPQEGETVTITKIVAYATDRGDHAQDIAAQTLEALEAARAAGFSVLAREQRHCLERFWSGAAIHLDGAGAAQAALRFSMFQIFQAVGRDGWTSVGAKGQTGEGYEGHYFWDAELFTLPLIIFSAPEIARRMLLYRYRTLDQARRNARQLGHQGGASFAWRTISGRECSAYFPAGAAQYHINADIAYAVRQYVDATGDEEFLAQYGVEMLAETARIWLDLGHFNPHRGGCFCINEVTGPDEYSALVDNNFYTNWMARAHLYEAAKALGWLCARDRAAYDALSRKIGLKAHEAAAWRAAADKMYLPYEAELGVYAQDDGFAGRKPWDFAGTPAENYPLLLHYHPMHIYRRKVCKQADVLMALFLYAEQFSEADKRRCFDYYEAVTVHDSTLSACIFSIVASDIGAPDKAWRYFEETALVDLEDRHGNTGQGLHIAAMGGSWMALSFGFGGLCVRDGKLGFSPVLPDGLQGYGFRLRFRGRLIETTVDADQVVYHLIEGDALTFTHNASAIVIETGDRVRLPGAACHRIRENGHAAL